MKWEIDFVAKMFGGELHMKAVELTDEDLVKMVEIMQKVVKLAETNK